MTPRELRAIESRISVMHLERLNGRPAKELPGEVRGPGRTDEQRAGSRGFAREQRKALTAERVQLTLPLVESGKGAKEISELLAISIDRARHVLAEARKAESVRLAANNEGEACDD